MSEQLKTRIKQLSSSDSKGRSVLYVMSRDHRVQDNHALIAAQKHALASELPLAVLFCLYDKVGVRAREHYSFMLEGLEEVEKSLRSLNIPFILTIGSPEKELSRLFKNSQPDAVYFDFNPLRGPQNLQKKLAQNSNLNMFVVDTHNIVPTWIASDKREIGARTIRTKIHKKLGEYLDAPDDIKKHPYDWTGDTASMNEMKDAIQKVVMAQKSNGTKIEFVSGETAALSRLEEFVSNELEGYAENRNDPADNALSDMSPYLHFGQISSIRVALKMRQIANGSGTDLHLLDSGKMPNANDAKTKKVGSANVLLEEMIVRKELSDNFCYYEPDYDSVDAADNWANKTITQHDSDPREHEYSYKQLEGAKTHDSAWNASQRQLVTTGKMHGYMRMYWAKKIKEWTCSAETAIKYTIELNDHYSLDGGDPNGYVGILWSIIGVHDRAWTEREVFGKVRYMNYGGLKRKFDIVTYEQKWNNT